MARKEKRKEERKEAQRRQDGEGKGHETDSAPLTIKEGYENSDYYSGKSSDIARQLAFAGLAVIWVFKTEFEGRQIIPQELFLPSLLIVISLALDLLHYVVSGEIWYRVTRSNEKADIAEFKVSAWVNWPGVIFYWAKIVAVIIAYLLLIVFLASRLFRH